MQLDTHHSETKAAKALLETNSDGTAFIRLGAPDERVVTITMERMESLRVILEHLKVNCPRGVVVTGPSADMFTAGADIALIRDVTDPARGEALAREGQKVFDLLAALPCTTVAAISGPCVGGGCELVLACNYRLISDRESSTIGLPEIKLGIIPGFGGTQRLPRLIGLPKALDIILAGKTLRPSQARSAGLVEDVVPYDSLLSRAEAIAAGKVRPARRPLSFVDRILTHTGFGRSIVRKNALKSIRKQSKGHYPAPPAALDAALFGFSHGLSRGLENEAKELGRMIVTPESKALVRIFFLSEVAKGLGKSAKKDVATVNSIVIGAGVMGAGIAGMLAKNSASVILKDTTDENLARGVEHIKGFLSGLKYLSEAERSFILNRIEITTKEVPGMANANIAIEAVFEDLALKKKIISELSKTMPADAIIATNTSSLPVSKIASAAEYPERVVGMHFFNPVEKMPLVEIVRGDETADRAICIVAALTIKLGKFPILVRDVPGFLVNRVLSPYLTEASFMLSEGYAIHEIDEAATDFGMPMGPLRLLDEVGLDVAQHVAQIMLDGYGERMRGPGYAKRLVEMGRKGKKSGGGFYDHGPDGRAVPCEQIQQFLGITAQHPSQDKQRITDRLIMSLLNEAVRCLDEGVAGNPSPEAASQIDLGMVMGTGFPPFRGGILHYADSIGVQALYDKLNMLEREVSSRFHPAVGFHMRIQSGKTFCA